MSNYILVTAANSVPGPNGVEGVPGPQTVDAVCPIGEKVLGGGYANPNPAGRTSYDVESSFPRETRPDPGPDLIVGTADDGPDVPITPRWTVFETQISDGPALTVYAICADATALL